MKKLIKSYFLVDLEERHQGDWDEVIKKQFLNARAVQFGKNEFLAPLWELVNHEVVSLPFIINQEMTKPPPIHKDQGTSRNQPMVLAEAIPGRYPLPR